MGSVGGLQFGLLSHSYVLIYLVDSPRVRGNISMASCCGEFLRPAVYRANRGLQGGFDAGDACLDDLNRC